MYLIGIDVGGTFTDLVCTDTESNRTLIHKVPTTAEDPSIGVIDGLTDLCARNEIDPSAIDHVFHGTTVATNAVLEHDGARTGMITTEGFRDILHIGRHWRPENYSIQLEIPRQDRPLVRRQHRLPVRERLVPPRGDILLALDEEDVRHAARVLKDDGVKSVAVCFLFSYLNSCHEDRAKQILLEEIPDCFVTTSSEVAPQFREFERFTTAALNAFVGPKVRNYVSNLSDSLENVRIRADLHIMASHGGVVTAATVAEKPVMSLLSGPAAGVLGGAWAGANSGRDRLITFDVGGTSADIGIVVDGQHSQAMSRDTWIGGQPVLVSMIDISTIGAGGGSIAYVDEGGAFQVGPQSAGSQPGPAAYGKAGDKPTVTDANLVLGRLDKDNFLGGAMLLDESAAYDVIDELAHTLEVETREAAEGVLTIVNSNMANAIRARTIQRGLDPREFSLVAFGGAGPLHGAEVAAMLEIPEVIIPPHPGITSATGLLTTDLKYEQFKTEFQVQGTTDLDRLRADFEHLERMLLQQYAQEGVARDQVRLARSGDLRYVGQGYELRAEIPDGHFNEQALDDVWQAFHQMHKSEYGHHFPNSLIEIVNIRVTGVGEAPSIGRPSPEFGASLEIARVKSGACLFRVDDKLQTFETAHYRRADLPVDAAIPGPAVILQRDTTIVVPPGWSASTERSGNIVIRNNGLSMSTDETSLGSVTEPAVHIDRITARVIQGALENVAVEMGFKLMRMSHSSLIRESEDFGAAIIDSQGRQVAETPQSTPLQSGPLPGYIDGIRRALASRGEEICPGDVYIHNDAYAGASHVPDVAFCVPVFHRDRLVGFSATAAHHVDIGAHTPGSAGIVDAVDAYAEGLQLKGLKVYDRGVRNNALWTMLGDNIRAPDLVLGDMEAKIAACRIGGDAYLGLIERYGLDLVQAAAAELMDYSERMMRAAIQKLPDGIYSAKSHIDGFLDSEDPARRELPIEVTLTIDGSELSVDFTGTARQVDDRPINMPLHGTVDCAIWTTLRSILLDSAIHGRIPQNSGLTRPIKIVAPEGTLVNPIFPAPTIARACPAIECANTIMKALAQVVPEQVSAGVGNLNVIAFSGIRGDSHWVHMEIYEGAYGGRYRKDGIDAVDILFTNTRNNPIEDTESHMPLRIHRYELRDDGHAQGKWRGGIGAIRETEWLEDGGFSIEGEGQNFQPWGFDGGTDGLTSSITLQRKNGDSMDLPSKVPYLAAKAGDRTIVTGPCGGGYGNSFERDPQRVLEDVRDGYISIGVAKQIYGVVIAGDSTVDVVATEELRKSRKPALSATVST